MIRELSTMLESRTDTNTPVGETCQSEIHDDNTQDHPVNRFPDEEHDGDIDDLSISESPQVYPNRTTDLINSSSEGNNNDDDDDDDDDDDYLISDDEDLSRILSHDLEHARLPGSRNMADHVKFFTDTLSQALDCADIDKSLVLEAQISGNLNNENQKIIEKKELLLEKLRNLQVLYGENFGMAEDAKQNRVDRMRNDITNIEQRIARLKNGAKGKSSIPFLKGKQRLGVVQKFPIEYNQAKDKVLERQFDGNDYNINDNTITNNNEQQEEDEDDLIF